MIEWEEHNKKDCCIVIPVYKTVLTNFEAESLRQCIKIFSGKHDICFAAPESLDLSVNGIFKIKRFADDFFKSIDGYNELCRRWEFYDTFKEYKYILVYQLDCWVFEDRLDYFIGLGYDWFGAPWFERKDGKFSIKGCGNGGFSLRKVDKMFEICRNHKDEADDQNLPEDLSFCERYGDELNICPIEIGMQFSFEVAPQVLYKLNGDKLPMGCHKPKVFAYNIFWKKYIDEKNEDTLRLPGI